VVRPRLPAAHRLSGRVRAVQRLLRTTTVSLASSYAYAVPIIAYLVGVLTLGGPFHPIVLAGATAIIIAVAAEARATSRPGQ